MTQRHSDAIADTGLAAFTGEDGPTQISLPPLSLLLRTTVLPRGQLRDDAPELVQKNQARYETVRDLGEGGVGEVVLVKDNDIHRQVAMKRLKARHKGTDAILRFVDEIHTIGQLEHPGIVPIHDVGIDENGRYFFIMKYVQGETLESIISKLAAGDPAYHRRFTFEQRTALFMQVLRTVHFAHERGFIHRDLKPSNIMVGNFGEVVVMDWGLAKQVRRQGPGERPAVPAAPRSPAQAGDESERISTTQQGALLGTPAYMSPEQAAGDHVQMDQRSDIYSLSVLFYELLTLRHPLAGKDSLKGVLYGVLYEGPTPALQIRHPAQGGVPIELWYFVERGLSKKPEDRYPSLEEMITQLKAIVDGKIHVVCPFTGMKRGNREFMRFIDRRPLPALFAVLATTSLAIYGGVQLVHHLAALWH